jgi:Ser/Thr protein kinase RdoA (MazF antagonist)
VADKEEYLDQRYGKVLRSAHGLDAIWNRFLDFGAELGTTEIRSTWSHSDFKPSNVLCNKTKYIVLDTRLNINAPVVFDIACFLAHFWIQLRKSQPRTDYSFWGQLEQSFLRGYAGLSEREMQALQWAQLYYMLHYLGRYQEHSGIRAIYGRWNTLPVLHRLAAKLQSAGGGWKNNENVS